MMSNVKSNLTAVAASSWKHIRAKKKLYHKEGVIEGTYPSIFTVKVKEEKRAPQRLSFSYSDVLTRSVKIDLLDTEIEGAFTY
ncbi:MAG: Veg family protein [Eubacterium sp.]